MQDEIVERLEIKLAFLERATSELSDVVYKQQRDIVALNDRLAQLTSRFDAFRTEGGSDAPEEERPPHY